jgi:N utilization substance protein A
MLRILDSIARDRNIDRTVLLRDLEQAMVSALRKHYNTLDLEEFACTIDPMTGQVSITRHGAPLELTPAALGRIAAQTFKQVMIQKFRDDERSSIFEEFSKRLGEIVTGTAQRYEGGALVVTIDRAEAFMPRSEQIPGEQFAPGDRVRCLILDVRDVGSQIKIVLSRAHPDFIKRLFEVEVPEVSEKIIEIKAMAREAGYRTKIAVSSVDSKVDAVGACVGVRGSRIKNIVDELNGEKIDIVRWNESSQILIQNSLKPAEVSEISLCFELGRATVVVRDDQLSLAIGRRGQNVRLAAQLTGWRLDIVSKSKLQKRQQESIFNLSHIEGVNETMAHAIYLKGKRDGGY